MILDTKICHSVSHDWSALMPHSTFKDQSLDGFFKPAHACTKPVQLIFYFGLQVTLQSIYSLSERSMDVLLNGQAFNIGLAGVDPVVEGNHGENSKRWVARILRLSSLAKFYYSLYFYFYERKQNKCVHVLYCDITRIKEDCCWLIFFKTKYSV